MSGFDWVIAVIFLVSIVIGLMRGFVREALSIVSWIMAIWLGITFCEPAGDFIGQFINIPAAAFRTSAGFALVFVGTLFLFSIISYVISKLIVKGAIKGTDRILGLGFGALRAIAVVIAVILVARGLGMQSNEWWQNSNYLKYFESTADYIETLLPNNLQTSTELTEDADQDIPVNDIDGSE